MRVSLPSRQTLSEGIGLAQTSRKRSKLHNCRKIFVPNAGPHSKTAETFHKDNDFSGPPRVVLGRCRGCAALTGPHSKTAWTVHKNNDFSQRRAVLERSKPLCWSIESEWLVSSLVWEMRNPLWQWRAGCCRLGSQDGEQAEVNVRPQLLPFSRRSVSGFTHISVLMHTCLFQLLCSACACGMLLHCALCTNVRMRLISTPLFKAHPWGECVRVDSCLSLNFFVQARTGAPNAQRLRVVAAVMAYSSKLQGLSKRWQAKQRQRLWLQQKQSHKPGSWPNRERWTIRVRFQDCVERSCGQMAAAAFCDRDGISFWVQGRYWDGVGRITWGMSWATLAQNTIGAQVSRCPRGGHHRSGRQGLLQVLQTRARRPRRCSRAMGRTWAFDDRVFLGRGRRSWVHRSLRVFQHSQRSVAQRADDAGAHEEMASVSDNRDAAQGGSLRSPRDVFCEGLHVMSVEVLEAMASVQRPSAMAQGIAQ